MKAAELFVRCLENEGVTHIFGIPGEENIDVMDALLDSSIQFVTTRHEQGAAFMADVYGRLTGKAGVCLATLGPGATNLVTGVADANMDRAPLVAISGQAATTRLHKESHQHLDLVRMFEPITKYSIQLRAAEVIPEVVRKAFKVAEAEKPGACFIDVPENIAAMDVEGLAPLKVQRAALPEPAESKLDRAAELIQNAKFPVVLAGNGIVRTRAADDFVRFVEALDLPVATTFMAKGVLPATHPLSLGTIGLQSHDYVACGFDRADVIICVGYDMVEYAPHLWHATKDRTLIHIDTTPAEVDAHYILSVGIVGDIASALEQLAPKVERSSPPAISALREKIRAQLTDHAENDAFPMVPQRIIWDLREALAPEDIVISDVGAHKMWMARLYKAERPNTCIISNGFASMAIGLPGTIAAKIAYPDRVALTVCGDAGFLMNSQEIETALRIGTPIIVLVWRDNEYGLIHWHQLRHFGRPSHIEFGNPDLVKYAESFGAKGYRIGSADELLPTLKQAIEDDTVVIIDCPVDYAENMKLTEELGNLVCPI